MLRKFQMWKRNFLLKRHTKKHGPWFDHMGQRVYLATEANAAIRYLLYKGRYERPEAALIDQYVNTGDHVIELGGSLGIISQLTRKKIGENATQIIVEGDPELADICTRVQKISVPNDNTKMVSAAVAYSGTTVQFSSGNGNAHIGRVDFSNAQGGGEGMIEVPTIHIAQLRDMLPEGKSVLICDVEGAELDILDNESDMLKLFSVAMIEFHPHLYVKDGLPETAFFDACARKDFKVLEVIDNVAVIKALEL